LTLTPKQRRFVDEYIADLNATQAAIRAGYSRRTAKQQGSRLLSNANVRGEIERRRASFAAKSESKRDAVLRELAAIAFSDIGKVVRWGPNDAELLDSNEIDAETTAAIAEIWRGKGGQVRVRLHDKVKALATLGRHLGMRGGNRNDDPTQSTPRRSPDLKKLTDEQLRELEAALLAIEADIKESNGIR
jgi:phage terminase small subunit